MDVYLTLLFNWTTTAAGPRRYSTAFSSRLFADILTHPQAMWAAMQRINEEGTWTLKGSTAKGGFLWFVWAVEALIIAGSALLCLFEALDPFSETSKQWAEEEALGQPAGFATDAEALRRALETGQFQALVPCAEKAKRRHLPASNCTVCPTTPLAST